jgi:hypothetical protein
MWSLLAAYLKRFYYAGVSMFNICFLISWDLFIRLLIGDNLLIYLGEASFLGGEYEIGELVSLALFCINLS